MQQQIFDYGLNINNVAGNIHFLFNYENQFKTTELKIQMLNDVAQKHIYKVKGNIALEDIDYIFSHLESKMEGVQVDAIVANGISFTALYKSGIDIDLNSVNIMRHCAGSLKNAYIYIYPTVPENVIYFFSRNFFMKEFYGIYTREDMVYKLVIE